MPVFFIDSRNISGKTIAIGGDLHQHLAKSLRTRTGETLIFNDEHSTRYYTTVKAITPNALRAEIIRMESPPWHPPCRITLGQAILKGEKMNWVVQKATELGVHAITPIQSHRVVSKSHIHDFTNLLKRWSRIGEEAAQQSERWTLPTINPVQSYAQFLNTSAAHFPKLLLAERSDSTRLIQFPLPNTSRPQSLVVAIGPEGGWTPQEIAGAKTAGFSLISLGTSILRAETASLASLAILQARMGEL